MVPLEVFVRKRASNARPYTDFCLLQQNFNEYKTTRSVKDRVVLFVLACTAQRTPTGAKTA
jgi:hypothetical protein